VTEIVTNMLIWAVSILMRAVSEREVNADAGKAPVDTSWLFLPILMSVMRKSSAMEAGITSRSGRKITCGCTLMFADVHPELQIRHLPRREIILLCIRC